jgi:eukaryotic-like serine/threonine-protein kinase
MPLAAGARLGPYVIVGPLGVGGMGEVYRARDERLGRDVALKVVPEGAQSPDRLERFAREARAAAAVHHPNLRAIYDVGTEAEPRFLVTSIPQNASPSTTASCVITTGVPAAELSIPSAPLIYSEL